MKKNIANELKKLDIEIARRLFSISKENKIEDSPSPLQGRILKYLVKNQDKEIYQKDLEDIFQISKATVSSVLFTMENNKIIQRVVSSNDARSKRIELTEKSKEVYKNMQIVFEKLNKELEKGLSEEEINTFYNILDKLYKNIKITN